MDWPLALRLVPLVRVTLAVAQRSDGFGAVAMARGADPNSGGSQFLLELTDDAAGPLAGRYAAFGSGESR